MATSFDIEVNVSTENGAVLKTGLMYKQGKPAMRLIYRYKLQTSYAY